MTVDDVGIYAAFDADHDKAYLRGRKILIL